MTALVLWMFRESIFEGRVFFRRDITLIWYPQIEVFVRCIASGSWPVWDPYRGFGEPLLADPSSQVLYPLTWLNLLMPPWAYYTLFAASHVLLSALGLYALGRRWGLSRGGSFVAAAIWAVSGPFLSLVDLYHHLASAAWIPWVLLAADRALTSAKTSHALVWGAVAAAQILAGSADMVALTALAVVLLALTCHVRWEAPLGESCRRLAMPALLAALFGLALSAAVWLPAWAASQGSERWSLPAEVRTVWSVHPRALIEILFPFRWIDLPLLPSFRLPPLEDREPWLHSIYLGSAASGLVLASLASKGRRSRFLLVLGVLAILIALGRHFIAYDVAVFLLPPLRIFRYPAKAMVLAALAWCFLAGHGFDVWSGSHAFSRSRWRFCVSGPLLVLTLLGALGAVLMGPWAENWGPLLFSRHPRFPSYADKIAPASTNVATAALFCAAAAGLALLRRPGGISSPHLAAGVAALGALDLVTAHGTLNLVAPKELLTTRPPVLQALQASGYSRTYVYDYSLFRGLVIVDERRRRMASGVFHIPAFTPRSQAEILSAHMAQTYLNPPIAGRWGLFGSYDADLLGLLRRPAVELNQFLRAVENTPIHLRLLRMGGVAHVLTLHVDDWTRELTPVATAALLGDQRVHVFGVPDPLPRTYAVGDARIARDGPEAFEALADPGFDPRREVILPEGDAHSSGAPFSGTSRVLLMKPDHVRLQADLDQAGYVVLLDAHDPGWRATMDGGPVPILRANVAFRALRVPAGRHVIDLVYRPTAVWAGLAVSAVSFSVGLVLAGSSLLQGAATATGGDRGPAS